LSDLEQRAEWFRSRFGLERRTALVTGGSSGIGEAMARALGLAGAQLVIAGRRQAMLAEAISRFRVAGLSADHVVCDLTLPKGRECTQRRCIYSH